MLPRLAVVDPELTYELPRAITASTGLDALTQLIEPYVSVRANPMTDQFCVEGMRRAAGALPRVWENGGDRQARCDMAWASLLGGMALANAALGAVHGFAAPLGGMFPAPHGAVCAALLPHAMEVNVRALRARAPEKLDALRRSGASPNRKASCHRPGWRGVGRRSVPEAGDSAAAQLWRHAERSPRPGRKGGAGEQYEGEPDRPDGGGITRNHFPRPLILRGYPDSGQARL